MSEQPVDQGNQPRMRKPLWRRPLKWFLRVVAGLLLIAGAAWCVLDYTSGKALDAEIAKIQAAGEPLTFAELALGDRPSLAEPLPPAPSFSSPEFVPPAGLADEAADAAAYYEAAIVVAQSGIGARADLFLESLEGYGDAAVPGEVASEIDAYLAESALPLEMIDKGAQCARCGYDLDLPWPKDAFALPHMGPARVLAKLVRLRTQWLARRGRAGEAADSLVSSLRMLRMFDHQPVLLAWLVKVACLQQQVLAVPSVLAAESLSDQDLAKVGAALALVDPSGDMHDVLLAERVWLLEEFCALAGPRPGLESARPQYLPGQVPVAGLLARPIIRRAVVGELRMYERLISASGKAWPEVADAVRTCEPSPPGLAGQFVPTLGAQLDAMGIAFMVGAQYAGHVRSAEVAVKAQRFRLAKGRLPASLNELRGFVRSDLPTDPFTGEDLIYEVQGGAFAVYSVGKDLSDDGGPSEEDWLRDPGVSVGPFRPAGAGP